MKQLFGGLLILVAVFSYSGLWFHAGMRYQEGKCVDWIMARTPEAQIEQVKMICRWDPQ